MAGCQGCLGVEEWGPEGPPAEDVQTPRVASARVPAPAHWRRLPPRCEAKLARVIRRWIGTPYMDGQRVRGAGVDCRYLIAALLDEWSGASQPIVFSPTPYDAGIHSPRPAFVTLREIRRKYPLEAVRDGTFEPGDILLMASYRGGSNIGHGALVTPMPGTAVHAGRRGVTEIAINSLSVLRQYRPTGKQSWT